MKNLNDEDLSLDCNQCYSPNFMKYLIDYWAGVTPIFTNILLGDISRHGNTAMYTKWKRSCRWKPCIRNPIKTQGIIEKHHDNVKNVFADKK